MSVEDSDVEVTCMHKLGVNRFYWPAMEDVSWYEQDDIICFIEEPIRLDRRAVKIDELVWSAIEKSLDLNIK